MAWSTHEVFNQVAVLKDYNLYATDTVLQEAVEREGAAWHTAALSCHGALLGEEATIHLGELANRCAPELTTHDRAGHRIDQIEFHPAWSKLMEMLYAAGVHCLPWAMPRPGAHAARAATFFLHGQIEAGSLCPTTMTFAAIPLLMNESALFAQLQGNLFSRRYDGRDLPLAQKHAMTIGMGMTEKQGGSDLRGNTTLARRSGSGGRGEAYALVGHKWFFSAPTSDAHLVLARADEGLACFYVPRWRTDGTRNAVRIQRLKQKLGNRSNASAEVEFCDAEGIMIGVPGRGIATAIEMAAHTRLDCVLGSAALMRQALVQAIHHARQRAAFGRSLIEQPLMQAVLIDLALESEAATRLALRLASACERAAHDPLERALWRIVTPAAKFWICKRTIVVVAECMEVLGGNGYVEDGPLARLYREAPVNSIWEGSGNVVCLDVLRGLARETAAAQALLNFLTARAGSDTLLASAVGELVACLQKRDAEQAEARWIARQMILLLQATLLAEAAPQYVAEAFISSRMGSGTAVFGAAAQQLSVAQKEDLLARAWPCD
ncbi:isovaleryl CoA dehydrogenase [Georgfuchsia toluolica]|uniref:Isovaleryl CoA dehydrogenase n=1 Tax=Georgfuchsia toluolica TaxID=424218 RepID=A0A916J1T1_9PROT|nr:isovaleryl-CoA dehydrogenase [Georgfuchsia toluolica]CAG4882434.1 isovaleryl CoA dehydrogenase [Georgfuchsia toluolica]